MVATIVAAEPVVANACFAAIQLALGAALLTRRYARLALGASIVWALSIWLVGEGLGGVATGATLLAGAPGAALLYAVIACLAWPPREPTSRAVPSRLAAPAWSALWLTAAALQLLDGNDTGSSITQLLRSGQTSSPGWIATIDRHLDHVALPNAAGAALVAVELLIAVWVLVPGWTRTVAVGAGLAVGLSGWLLVQGLGDLTSGQATDPNLGPLLALLAYAVVAGARELAATTSPRVVHAGLPGLWGDAPVSAPADPPPVPRLASASGSVRVIPD